MANFSNLSDQYKKLGIQPIDKWVLFFHAGMDWLRLWELMKKSSEDLSSGYPFFYAQSHIIHFCLELFTKALIAYSEKDFNPRKNNHKTLNNILEYQKISPLFRKISKDSELSNLIREYEKTVDTRFGETIVVIESGDTEKMMNLVYEMRLEILKKTGL